jgi:hypothetical protein
VILVGLLGLAYASFFVYEKPTRGMLVKSLLYGDVSEKPMMRMSYPFSIGTLTFVRTIETFVEIVCHRLFSLCEAIRTSCIIKSPNQ